MFDFLNRKDNETSLPRHCTATLAVYELLRVRYRNAYADNVIAVEALHRSGLGGCRSARCQFRLDLALERHEIAAEFLGERRHFLLRLLGAQRSGRGQTEALATAWPASPSGLLRRFIFMRTTVVRMGFHDIPPVQTVP